MRADYGGSDEPPPSPALGAGVGGAGGGGLQEAEDIELQLALALSKEEHEQEIRRREAEGLKEDMKLRMALEASKRDEEVSNACCAAFVTHRILFAFQALKNSQISISFHRSAKRRARKLLDRRYVNSTVNTLLEFAYLLGLA